MYEGVDDEDRLAELLSAAIDAGEACRRAIERAGRCPECGRPLVDSVALAELVDELDRRGLS